MTKTNGQAVDVWHGLEGHTDGLDLVISDLWGVMHDGIALNASAVDAIINLRSEGINTVFLSNAPRPRAHVREHLISMGLPKALGDFIVTSGGLARDEVRRDWVDAKLYHLGPRSDHNTIEGLPVTLVDKPGEADVILATALDFNDVAPHAAWLRPAAEKGVPLLCANPDRIVHVGNDLYPCAGAVADLYEDLGGPVHWFGKPTVAAMQSCLTEAGMPADTPGERILMVGDSLVTDIAGARAAGYGAVLIGGGIHRDEMGPFSKALRHQSPIPHADFAAVFGHGKVMPDVLMLQLAW
ncbi:TIGR01459 family HAD-type hydrolase [Pseudokordiimonas caeni]|uniref:TIGR01459 family HAD-type hydrolase n=1 Tax=Pseudokordiimonas caeni TaxID=2997908 RepID=UPI002811617D|nr:TIGR01459 family HAD-type hydrolase [Pseudokordiimonas caeni]